MKHALVRLICFLLCAVMLLIPLMACSDDNPANDDGKKPNDESNEKDPTDNPGDNGTDGL